jgi:hypothetical protein
MSVKTTQYNEAFYTYSSVGAVPGRNFINPSFGITNCGIYATYANLSSDDLTNILKSRIEFPLTK